MAFIAEQNLPPSVLQKVRALLPSGGTLETLSNLADDMKKDRPETKSWHYIDLPVRETVTKSDLPNYYSVKGVRDANIVSQINREIEELRNPAQDSATKREALLFLVHFMGDLHMPLHCADDKDKGGNLKKIRSGTERRVNLHLLWDFIVSDKEPTEDAAELGKRLAKAITPEQKKRWVAGAPEDWVLETYDVARSRIYRDLREGPGEIDLPADYIKTMRPVAEMQLQKAGIRLARILSTLF